MCDDEWQQFCNNEYTISNNEHESQGNTIPKCPKADELYISTKSKIGYLNKPINLSDVFWKIPITEYHNNREGVIKKQIKLTIFWNILVMNLIHFLIKIKPMINQNSKNYITNLRC